MKPAESKMKENAWVIQVIDQVNRTTNDPNTEANRWQRQSIYKLPACVTEPKKYAYKPLVVSFGPYHRNDQDLKPMEEHKDRALIQFLKRSNLNLKFYFNSLLDVVQDLKDAYNPLDPEFQHNMDVFLQLMIRDGCFMLEILRFSAKEIKDYSGSDPVFSSHGRLYVIPYIKRDMFLLENQLPMLVLHKLLQVQNGLAQEDQELANRLVYRFFFPNSLSPAPTNCLHVLDMYRKNLLQYNTGTQQGIQNVVPHGGDDIIRSAIELDEAGIKFKRNKTRSLRDITFENGTLRLPMIQVDDTTEPLFLNLIAFERFHVGAGNEVTSYVFFMDNIIEDARDISLLHYNKIIQNGIGSDKAAAKLFNSLSKDITLDQNSSLGMVYKKVNEHCTKRWPRWRSNLYHTYFTNPWAVLSVLAAIFLFGLTITQTVYSIVDFYRNN